MVAGCKAGLKIKILQVCNLYHPQYGGLEEHVRNISERLAKRHDVTVFTTDPSGILPRVEEINGVRVRRFKAFCPNNAYFISSEMFAEIRRCRFDIVHGHNYHAFPLFLCKYASTSLLVITPHYHRYGSSTFRNLLIKLYKPLGRQVFQKADKVIALCEYEKDLLRADFAVVDDKIEIVPNGINKIEFNNLRRKATGYSTILYVSRLLNYKGIQHAVRVLPLIDADIRLEIVGSGPEKESLVKLARSLGVSQRIDFYQGLERKELLEKYANADLLLLLSSHEAFGIAIAEALAARIPCIVSNCSGLAQWIDNTNCFGIEYPVNIGRLATLVRLAIGREVSNVKLWDWDDVVNRLETLYTK
jgi:glycosyltransferase involved in cell wall biosynthesis